MTTIKKTIKMTSCNKMQHDVAAFSSKLQPDMLPHLFQHVAAGYVAAGHVASCPSMLQPDVVARIEYLAAS